MMKPPALSDTEITAIEDRIIRGWVVRRDQWVALLAMARERNLLLAERAKVSAEHEAQATLTLMGYPWTGTP